mmetsp:Transcript_18846/g.38314  ORF Transcript_18846/g.38314 Transcript_18846/m.38314 type:complete len:259 (-) Transcript_18846:45-821(-)|eukprot:CAMPEP_0181295632 /NCGR_PEP_ID=MMETSP1101-20121128/4255_1 /TAXON_ID=46948 /ORGANISM="Rhodomonas abbreviata, Strain Caron Lab Isolate" /LENGTH=258 /DNA_ID=CAMNT_0023400405 /DNA_START=265 /DNA_END=1041 /DNA_ORIENTATION=-
MSGPSIPSWAGTPPDNDFELKNKLSDGPASVKFNERSHLIVGRSSSDATVTLASTTASRVHALIVHNAEDGLVYIIDLKSAHGTHVDGHRIQPDKPTVLKINQEIQFGDNQGGARYEVKSLCAKKRVLEGPREDGDSKKSSSQVQVRCSHVLVKHNQSRKLRSDRDPEGTVIRARTKQEAKQMLEGYIRDLKNEEISFEELAAQASDCSSHKRRGDLGYFLYEKMQPSFSKAAFALKIGELSSIVETDSGVHIIKRTG